MRAGEPVALAAPLETVEFLLSAKSQSVEIDGQASGGLTAGPNRAGDRVMLAASLRMKPGAHSVKIAATSDSGEQRETTLDVVVNALPTVPSGFSRPPVVLLNGWQTGFTGSCPVSNSSSVTFGNLAQYLVADGVPVVYFFDNCAEDPNQTIEVLANDLALFLNSIQYDNGTQVPQIDLVAHSMGGLIARTYLAGLQPQAGVVLTPPANTLVRKLVLIATPNFGSFVAGTFAAGLAAGTQSAELIPGSSFLWNLGSWNQYGDDLRGVDAIAVVGDAGTYNSTIANASDGLVTLTSASLGFVAQQASVTRVVPYCHIDPAAFTTSILGTFLCTAQGIANVTDTSHLTGQIVRSFLAGTKDWMSIGGSPTADPYLSKNGGAFFAMMNTNGSYVTDLTQVTWGTVTLSNGGALGTIFYDDMVFGTGQYQAKSQSLGTFTCGSNTEAVGYVAVTRCKINATIVSVSPLANAPGRVVAAGAALTINGASFGTQCGNCKVTATPAGSTTAQTLQVSSWKATAITVTLPAALTGLLTLTVVASTGADNIRVMAVSTAAAIATAPTTLQFTYAAGGTVPAAQNIAISNTGSGELDWTATSSVPWLTVSAASGTAPSTLSVSLSPAGLSVGSYQGAIQVASTGVSNSPQSVTVTLTVTAAATTLMVAPQALTFQYILGASAPAAQNVTISNGGSGVLSWTAADGDAWVGLAPPAGSTPGTLAISVNPANLAAGSYTSNVQVTAAGAAGSPASIAVTLVVQTATTGSSITAVVNTGSYQPGFASATWVSIFGTSLASTTRAWQASDFVNGALPTSLDGVSVTINGIAAYVGYVSSTQVNVLAPDDAMVGPVQVQLTSGQQQSNIFTAQKAQYAPALFTINGGPYAAAQHADYTLVGSANLLPGVVTRPAVPGEVIQIYGTGFGPANPPLPTAQLVTTASVLAGQVLFTIGGVAAEVQYAGEVGSGLYQFNVTVPTVANGDAGVTATIGGVPTQTGVLITVQQ